VAKQCCDPPIRAAEGSNPCPRGEGRFRRGGGTQRHCSDCAERRRFERDRRRFERDDGGRSRDCDCN